MTYSPCSKVDIATICETNAIHANTNNIVRFDMFVVVFGLLPTTSHPNKHINVDGDVVWASSPSSQRPSSD